jgi:hypothetical protein
VAEGGGDGGDCGQGRRARGGAVLAGGSAAVGCRCNLGPSSQLLLLLRLLLRCAAPQRPPPRRTGHGSHTHWPQRMGWIAGVTSLPVKARKESMPMLASSRLAQYLAAPHRPSPALLPRSQNPEAQSLLSRQLWPAQPRTNRRALGAELLQLCRRLAPCGGDRRQQKPYRSSTAGSRRSGRRLHGQAGARGSRGRLQGMSNQPRCAGPPPGALAAPCRALPAGGSWKWRRCRLTVQVSLHADVDDGVVACRPQRAAVTCIAAIRLQLEPCYSWSQPSDCDGLGTYPSICWTGSQHFSCSPEQHGDLRSEQMGRPKGVGWACAEASPRRGRTPGTRSRHLRAQPGAQLSAVSNGSGTACLTAAHCSTRAEPLQRISVAAARLAVDACLEAVAAVVGTRRHESCGNTQVKVHAWTGKAARARPCVWDASCNAASSPRARQQPCSLQACACGLQTPPPPSPPSPPRSCPPDTSASVVRGVRPASSAASRYAIGQLRFICDVMRSHVTAPNDHGPNRASPAVSLAARPSKIERLL